VTAVWRACAGVCVITSVNSCLVLKRWGSQVQHSVRSLPPHKDKFAEKLLSKPSP
jgi:hypothetical protein